MKYISTSDEEDNDSDMASDPHSSEDSDDKDDKDSSKNSDNEAQGEGECDEKSGKIKKDLEVGFTGGEKLPPMMKNFNKSQKKDTKTGRKRVQYQYQYSNDPAHQQDKPVKTAIIRKRVDRKGPQNLVDVLIIQKLNMYEREERMRLLKEHDDEDWNKMQVEYNSSEDEAD